jgi:dTDP-4-amino-4,6-dideoxygalactose transaminase
VARVLPPAGTPFTFTDIVSAIGGLFAPRTVEQFEEEIKKVTGTSHALAVNTGRTALTLALLALKQGDAKNEVIMPGYTCFTVPSAIKRAGLRAQLVDFAPESMQYDLSLLEKLDTTHTLAIILIYPFAMYSNPEPILAWAKSRNVFVIEDVAQGFGLRHGKQMIGTLGDIGIYSFSKGKTITSVRGGVAITNNKEIAARLNAQRENECTAPGLVSQLRIIFEAIILWLFLPPSRFGLITKLPFVKLGETHYEPNFTLGRMSSTAAALAIRKTGILDQINYARTEVGRTQLSQLAEKVKHGRIVSTRESESEHSLFLRLVLLAKTQAERDRLLAEGKSLGFSRMYGEPLCVIDDSALWAENGKQSTPVAEDFAHRMLTLPTHAFVTENDLREMVRILSA